MSLSWLHNDVLPTVQGEIEQLSVSDEEESAGQQCSPNKVPFMDEPPDDNEIHFHDNSNESKNDAFTEVEEDQHGECNRLARLLDCGCGIPDFPRCTDSYWLMTY